MKHNFSLINGVISTVCPYPYGSCGLIKKKKKKSVELPRTILDDVTRLIKRCHTVRSQFADELNQAALFSGLKDSAARDWHSRQRQCCFCTYIYIYTRQIRAHASSCSYLIKCSVSVLLFPLSVFCLSRCPFNPLSSTRGLQWWLQKAKFEVSRLAAFLPAVPLTQPDKTIITVKLNSLFLYFFLFYKIIGWSFRLFAFMLFFFVT